MSRSFLAPVDSLTSRAARASLLLTIAVTLAGCQDQKSAISFSDFRKCQEDYCWKVAEFLNTPIDWHIVLDVSGSYFPASDPSTSLEKLLLVIRSLPLQDGDSLTLDAFSEVYYEGDKTQHVTSEWIQKIRGRNGTAIVQSNIEHLFTRLDNRPPFPKEITDITSPFNGHQPQLYSHTANTPTSSRLYYVVLTDGFHDPEGKQEPIPLFTPKERPPQFITRQGAISFLDLLRTFVSENQGPSHKALFLIIDPKPLDWAEGADPVRRDWDQGIRQIAHERTPFLHASFWNRGANFFSEPVRREIGRSGGVYPCLVTGQWKPGRWPTVTGFPYPDTITLPECAAQYRARAESPYNVEIPPDLANGQKESADLPLVLLASESRKRDLLATFKSSGGESAAADGSESGAPRIHGPTINSFESTRGNAYGGWTPIIHFIPVPSFEDDPSFRTPWILELSFKDQRERISFLQMKLSEASLGALVSASDSMSKRGKSFAFFAFVFWAISLLLAWHYAENVRISVEVRFASEQFSSTEVGHLPPRNYDRGKFRVRYAKIKNGRDSLEIEGLERESIPNRGQVDENHFVFDVIPIFNVVYHMIYLPSGTQRYRDGEQIAFASDNNDHDSLKGELVGPKQFWTSSAVPWLECDHAWRQDLPMQRRCVIYTHQGSPLFLTTTEECAVTTTLQEDRSTWLSRSFSVACSSLAFACSWAAFIKSLFRNPSAAWLTFVVTLVLALAFYSFLHWPTDKWKWKEGFGLLADTSGTFVLHASLALGLYASFFAPDSTSRIIVLVILCLFCFFAPFAYERLRNRLVSSRLRNRQPVNVWDFLLEIFLARLRS